MMRGHRHKLEFSRAKEKLWQIMGEVSEYLFSVLLDSFMSNDDVFIACAEIRGLTRFTRRRYARFHTGRPDCAGQQNASSTRRKDFGRYIDWKLLGA
ncbi:hypothetical protein PHLCEN_2v5974 [Hermanssonia centrifuga]|uniref:Uncharacterized protein n=1 Tax=Hermanssonia centrifuga TaxID=98765 RepID=A0A2R6P0R8_9APHY|nr:hypothetical protein PHLCEN_2v5974 [Hermanssonia centrifuga]